MAQRCKECNAEVDDNAAICPECGAPVKKGFSWGIGVAFVALAVVALIIILIRSCG